MGRRRQRAAPVQRPGHGGRGHLHQQVHLCRKTHTIDYEVTAYEPQRHFATQSTEGPFPFQGELDLERVGQGTKVTNTIDAGSDGLFTTITFKLLGPLVRISMRRQLHKELVALKSILEAD